MVLDADTAERRRSHFFLTGEALTLKQAPPGWTLVQEVDGATYDWYVFRTSAGEGSVRQ